jgi:hypothetical protein
LDDDLYGYAYLDGYGDFFTHEHRYLHLDQYVDEHRFYDADLQLDLDGNRYQYGYVDHDLYAYAHGGDELGEDGPADESESRGYGSV